MQFIYDKDKSVGTTLTQVLWGGGGVIIGTRIMKILFHYDYQLPLEKISLHLLPRRHLLNYMNMFL